MSADNACINTSEETWRPSYNPWWICVAVMIITIIEILDTTATSVAIPSIAGNLGVTNHEGTWVVTSYLVSNAIILPATAWLSGFFGRKRFLLICICIFIIASFFCGTAANFEVLLFSLVIQGIGGGALQPIALAVLMESFPKKMRGVAMAVYSMGAIVAPVVGPVLGGWLTDNLTWRWIFFINIPIGVLSIFMVNILVEDPPYLKKHGGTTSVIDYIGFTLMAIGLATLQIILDKGQTADWFDAPWIRWSALVVVLSLTAFSIWELLHKHPVVNLRVLKDRNLSIGLIITLLIGAVMYGVMTILPLYFQSLMGYTAYLSGLSEVSIGIGAFISSLILGQLASKVDGRIFLLVGLLIMAGASFLLVRNINLYISISTVLGPFFILGFGMSAAFVPLSILTLGTLSNEDMGNGSGLFNLMRNIGGSIGIAIVTTIAAHMAQVHQATLIAHLTPYNPIYQMAVQAGHMMHAPDQVTYGLMFKELSRQSGFLAYNNVFFWLGILSLACVPLVFLFRKAKNTEARVH